MIPNQTVEEIFNRARIEEVVGDFLTLKKRGVNLLGLCPFHNEKTPSFTVSPVKNIFKCFGCGRAGTPVGFIMEHENLSYVEALRYLAAKYNITIVEKVYTDQEKEETQHRESLLLINEYATTHFHANLMQSEYGRAAGLSYFQSRGFTADTIVKFKLGFAFPDGKDLYQHAVNNGYKPEFLEEIGLVPAQKKDFFINRVMFPVFNLSGRIVGFGGRTLSTSENVPKYLNSPESEIYNKSQLLYGFYQARNAIKKANDCYLVEGYTDVLSLHQAGIELAVASSGTSLTFDQARLISRFSEQVTILYDGDSAGIKAAVRSIEILLAQNLNVYVVILPEGNDPDSYLQEFGAQKLKDFIDEHKKDFILFKIQEINAEARQDPIKKIALLKDLIHLIAAIPDHLKRTVYAGTCAQLLDVDEKVIIQDIETQVRKNLEKDKLEQLRDKRNNGPTQTQSQKNEIETSDIPFLNELFHDLIIYGEKEYLPEANTTVKEYLLRELEQNEYYIDHPMYQALLKEYQSRNASGESNDIQFYLNHPDPEIRKLMISWLDPGYEYSPNWLVKHQMPLHYQPMPDKNYVNNIHNAMLYFRRAIYDHLNQENQQKIAKLFKENSLNDVEIQLRTQILIDQERKKLYDELGLVVNKWIAPPMNNN